jgi:hypothetical protein
MPPTDAFRFGGRVAWALTAGVFTAGALSVLLLGKTAELRYERDVNRMVFNDNLGVLDQIRTRLGMTSDSLQRVLGETPVAGAREPYIVVSHGCIRMRNEDIGRLYSMVPVGTPVYIY